MCGFELPMQNSNVKSPWILRAVAASLIAAGLALGVIVYLSGCVMSKQVNRIMTEEAISQADLQKEYITVLANAELYNSMLVGFAAAGRTDVLDEQKLVYAALQAQIALVEAHSRQAGGASAADVAYLKTLVREPLTYFQGGK